MGKNLKVGLGATNNSGAFAIQIPLKKALVYICTNIVIMLTM